MRPPATGRSGCSVSPASADHPAELPSRASVDQPAELPRATDSGIVRNDVGYFEKNACIAVREITGLTAPCLCPAARASTHGPPRWIAPSATTRCGHHKTRAPPRSAYESAVPKPHPCWVQRFAAIRGSAVPAHHDDLGHREREGALACASAIGPSRRRFPRPCRGDPAVSRRPGARARPWRWSATWRASLSPRLWRRPPTDPISAPMWIHPGSTGAAGS